VSGRAGYSADGDVGHDRPAFRLLGPLEVLRGGEPLRLGGERQRGLLALLLLHANELVTTEHLVEQLFGTDAPESSVRAVRVAVSRLRRLLDDETLVTRPGGYLVYADPSQLDVAEFEALVMEGRSALRDGDPTAAAASFRPALGLFRGPPLAARFAPDGSHLVVLYGDGTGFVWPTTVSAWIAHACTVAGHFTREEWRRYVPQRSYGPVCG
jgi:DNA-binding winged helix-turn-helix (wHTH) protein